MEEIVNERNAKIFGCKGDPIYAQDVHNEVFNSTRGVEE
jgi:hypothetical protein